MERRSSIKGILTNKTGGPMADAVIMIKEGSHEFNDIASISNDQGEFYVSDIVIPGKYTLQIKGKNATVFKEIDIQNSDTIIYIKF